MAKLRSWSPTHGVCESETRQQGRESPVASSVTPAALVNLTPIPRGLAYKRLTLFQRALIWTYSITSAVPNNVSKVYSVAIILLFWRNQSRVTAVCVSEKLRMYRENAKLRQSWICYVNLLEQGWADISTVGHIENFIATGAAYLTFVYFCYNLRFKNMNKR